MTQVFSMTKTTTQQNTKIVPSSGKPAVGYVNVTNKCGWILQNGFLWRSASTQPWLWRLTSIHSTLRSFDVWLSTMSSFDIWLVHPVDDKQSVFSTSSLRHVITRLRTDLEVCTCTRPRAPAGHAPASVWTRTRWSCAGAAAASSWNIFL